MCKIYSSLSLRKQDCHIGSLCWSVLYETKVLERRKNVWREAWRDSSLEFVTQIFFIDHFPLTTAIISLASIPSFFQKFTKIFATQKTPLVSITPAIFPKIYIHCGDTSGKLGTSVNDAGVSDASGILPPVAELRIRTTSMRIWIQLVTLMWIQIRNPDWESSRNFPENFKLLSLDNQHPRGRCFMKKMWN